MNVLQGMMLVALTSKATDRLWNAQVFEIRGDEAVFVKSVTSFQELAACLPGYQRIVKCQLLNLEDQISGIYQK